MPAEVRFPSANETWNMERPVCPWCGFVHRDWEGACLDGEEDRTECERCEREFDIVTSVQVTYTTRRNGKDGK